MPLAFAGAAIRLLSTDIDAEAAALDCDPAAVHAVCDVEAGGSGFLRDGRPKILFEAHVFGRLTGHVWDQAVPNISAPVWDRSLYGASGAHQYERLGKAIAIDRKAALMSASWGMFQVLGLNFASSEFADVEAMVAAMETSERAHLDAFAAFCRATHLDDELRAHDWAGFARGYNGPGYAANGYDIKLAGAWKKWSAAEAIPHPNPAPRTEPALFHGTEQLGSRGDDVRELQRRLAALGFAVALDGDFGPATAATVRKFQASKGLVADGVVGPLTWQTLGVWNA